jgi:TPR repeat protein
VAPAFVLACLWFSGQAAAQDPAADCSAVAASRWEAGHQGVTQELEEFDTAAVIAACEPALAADPANAEIKAWLGHAYLHDGRDDDAARLIVEAAQAGNATAQMVAADLYEEGWGVEADRQQALTMLMASAGQGFVPAQMALAEEFRWGEGLAPQDIAKAREWYEKAAGRGLALAQARLGDTYHYDLGDGSKPDYALAYRYYGLAASQKEPSALYGLGLLYRAGLGVTADRSRAHQYFVDAAELGYLDALVDLGGAYLNGDDFVATDYAKALDYLGRAAEQNDVYATSSLGYMYQFGLGTDQDYARAAELYQSAALRGDAYAQGNLGYLYQEGLGVPQDYARSAGYYQLAADQGDAYAQGGLGYLYLEGLGVTKDEARAAGLFQQAADQGSAFAQYNLGYLYESGLGVGKDAGKALALYEQAAAGGDLAAADALGNLYLEGIGTERDVARAMEYAMRAAEAGFADSQNRVGYMLAEGIGVPRDSAAALDWFRQAAAQGHEIAIRNVAELEAEAACAASAASQFEPGFESIGRDFEAVDAAVAIPACEDAVAKDPGSDENKAWLARAYLAAARDDEARPLLETAAAGDSRLARFLLGQVLNGDFGGDEDDHAAANAQFTLAADAGFAPAQLSLGYAYDVGSGVEADDAKAAEWYRKAAEQGLARAQASLGYLYHGGNGVPLDYALAMEWYARAAAQNDIVGIYGVGQLHEFGQGVAQDYGKAFEYFQRGADLGDLYAQADLGYLYDMGYGVAEDAEAAAYWYQQAADRGYALAQANLAQLYTAGRGVPQDYERALELYRSAHDQGEVSGTVGLAQAYLYAEGVDRDYAQARAYAQDAVDRGSVYGMGTLGYIYAEGLGVRRDFERAIELFDQAAATGNQYGIDRAAETRAERDCGLAAAASYEAGFESTGRVAAAIEADVAVPACELAVQLDEVSLENKTWLARAYLAAARSADAIPLFEAAVAGDWDPALVEFGDALMFGQNMPPDPARAFGLFAEAAGRRFGPAEVGVGLGFQYGYGVPIDFDAAERWYRRALDRGHADAQYSLTGLDYARSFPLTGPQRARPRG